MTGPEPVKPGVADIAAKSGWAVVTPGENPTASQLFAAIGGVRGLIESIAPGLLFLVVYTATASVVPSVLAPVAVSVILILVRIIRREPVMPAVSGAIGLALSAGIALFSGRAEDNFIPGFITNGVSIAVLLLSLLMRRPLIGVFAAALTADHGWRESRPKYYRALIATVGWMGVFSLRLIVELPLYFAQATGALAAAKLILGVPLYAAMLWVTWLLMRGIFGGAVESQPKNAAQTAE